MKQTVSKIAHALWKPILESLLPRQLSLKDVLIVILVVYLTVAAAFISAYRTDIPDIFYQDQYAPAALAACGYPMKDVAPGIEILDNFLAQETQSLDCDQLPDSMQTRSLNLLQASQYYLYQTTAILWKLTGPNWQIMSLIGYTLLIISTILYYFIFRLISGRFLSCFAAFWVSCLAANSLPWLRDFSKAPFILAGILILGSGNKKN